MSVVIDPQAYGFLDDGTESGAIRTKSVRSDLVAVPFRRFQYTLENSGCTVVYHNNYSQNSDGSCTGIYIQAPYGLNGCRIWQPFYGRTFGVRFEPTASTFADFTVQVDGVAVHVNGNLLPMQAAAENELPPGYNAYAITHDDLSEGLHVAAISVLAPQAASGSNYVNLLGYLVERRAGYREPVRVAIPIASAYVGTGQGNVYSAPGDGTDFQYLTQVFYYNTNGSAQVVTLENNGTIMYKVYLEASGTTGDSATVTFAMPTYATGGSLLTHACGTGSAVYYTVFGGV